MPHDYYACDCEPCQIERDKAADLWEAEAPEREQRRREQLDAEGYYDDPDAWHAARDARGR